MKHFSLLLIFLLILTGCIQKSYKEGSFKCEGTTDGKKEEDVFTYNKKNGTIRLVSIGSFVANIDYKASDTGNAIAWSIATDNNIISYFLDKETMKMTTIARNLNDKSETTTLSECKWIE